MIKKILKQDSFILGLITGIIAPWILLGILYCLSLFLGNLMLGIPYLLSSSTMQLLAIVVNVFAIRYYMIKLKYEKTGKGFLVITFIYIIAFFANEYILKW
ncbi:MAG: hypothetical protein V1904_08820 [Bacteroidota bacterium]